VVITESLTAPVKARQPVGEVIYIWEGEEVDLCEE